MLYYLFTATNFKNELVRSKLLVQTLFLFGTDPMTVPNTIKRIAADKTETWYVSDYRHLHVCVRCLVYFCWRCCSYVLGICILPLMFTTDPMTVPTNIRRAAVDKSESQHVSAY